jgi:tetratricopeptide (TPR) repeat protein
MNAYRRALYLFKRSIAIEKATSESGERHPSNGGNPVQDEGVDSVELY